MTRFGAPTLALLDPDGLRIELVAEPSLAPLSSGKSESPGLSESGSIRQLYSVALCVGALERTARLLTDTLGYEAVGEEAGRQRFRISGAGPAAIVDLLCQPDQMPGQMGAGTIHHVAFRAHNETEQLTWREAILSLGFDVTPVLDRQYFKSIYFREPSGVLFEIATDPPGFTIDESPETLGAELKLPPWLENRRAQIEWRLPLLRLNGRAQA
jgi:glyoxalase family protein